MSYASIEELRSQLGKAPASSAVTQAYAAKMLHKIPTGTVVDRSAFILERCKGKRVYEFGASGAMHEAIVKEAGTLWCSDKSEFDLDDVSLGGLPSDGLIPDVIVCGEVLEHLANPGWFLTRLQRHEGIPILITVPNAFATAGRHYLKQGIENVNIDHVAWYSPRTLWTLLERYHFSVEEFHWYHGEPITAEGLIVVVRA